MRPARQVQLLVKTGRYRHTRHAPPMRELQLDSVGLLVVPVSQGNHVMLLPEASPAGMQVLKGRTATARTAVADPRARAMGTSQPQRADLQVFLPGTFT